MRRWAKTDYFKLVVINDVGVVGNERGGWKDCGEDLCYFSSMICARRYL